jgi:histidinol-phosphate aminotransferase
MPKQRLSRKFWNPIVSKLSPYTPGEQPLTKDYIKLNTNENPTGPSIKVRSAIIKALKTTGTDLRLYPEPESKNLKKAIAQHHKVNINQIFVGNGSDEVLAFCFQGLIANRGTLALPEITYSFYPSLAKLFEINTKLISLSNNFSFDLNNLDSSVKSVIFANPNATTGISLTKNYIRGFLIKNPNILVIVDEAYIDFGAQSCLSLTKRYKNILVTQTFSKSRGLAGMRLGFAIGNIDLIHALNRVKNSFNTYPIDRLASTAGIASLKDKTWFDSNKK